MLNPKPPTGGLEVPNWKRELTTSNGAKQILGLKAKGPKLYDSMLCSTGHPDVGEGRSSLQSVFEPMSQFSDVFVCVRPFQ